MPWWGWMSLAAGLGIAELILPGFIFLGFAIGAALVGGLVAAGFALSSPGVWVVFGGLSLIVWVILRAIWGRQGQTRIITHDINDG